MSDLMTVVLAVAAAAGARAGHSTPVLVCGAVAVIALLARRPAVLVLAVGLLASGLSARAADGAQPVSAHRFVGWVTLLGDPAPAPGGVKVVVRVAGKHVELWSHGEAARIVRMQLAGERAAVRGVVRSMPETTRIRAARRHVVGRLTADEVLATAPASPVGAAANWVHRTLASGAEVLQTRAQALYLGFVVGDRRGVDPETEARFEAAGLTHLLAVSGENVAFVLAAAGPLLRRLKLHGRAVAAIGVIAFFATVTRFEPSVLRASAMAGVAAVAQATGRPASGLRMLALAVTGLLLVDPLLVWSVGFQLSVGASLGILLLAGPITRWLPGPRWLAEPLAVTAAAQLGVAPVAIPVFGSIPLAAIPANLLVAPVVGPLMMWGLVAGIPAGLLGERAASVLHAPTGLAIWWVDFVARVMAALPGVALDTRGAVALAVVAMLGFGHRWRRLGSPPWRAGPGRAQQSTSAALASTSPRDRW